LKQSKTASILTYNPSTRCHGSSPPCGH
jgi:hypothetical protein